MKVGDLVKKRWGRIDPWQQGTVAICLGPSTAPGLMLTGPLIKVVYPGRRPLLYRPEEFELISESR
jgi:hypothetical protein